MYKFALYCYLDHTQHPVDNLYSIIFVLGSGIKS